MLVLNSPTGHVTVPQSKIRDRATRPRRARRPPAAPPGVARDRAIKRASLRARSSTAIGRHRPATSAASPRSREERRARGPGRSRRLGPVAGMPVTPPPPCGRARRYRPRIGVRGRRTGRRGCSGTYAPAPVRREDVPPTDRTRLHRLDDDCRPTRVGDRARQPPPRDGRRRTPQRVARGRRPTCAEPMENMLTTVPGRRERRVEHARICKSEKTAASRTRPTQQL